MSAGQSASQVHASPGLLADGAEPPAPVPELLELELLVDVPELLVLEPGSLPELLVLVLDGPPP